MKRLIVSFLVSDEPGFVEQLSKVVSGNGGSWQQSCMQQMSDYFAGAFELDIPKEKCALLRQQIEDICAQQCQIVEFEAGQSDQQPTVTLQLTANDRVGIIQDITSVIHQQKGNLISLTSEQTNAPHTGQLMFLAQAKISVAEQQVELLVSALENLADDLMVDISM